MKYVDQFLSLNCSSDVLNIVRPINKFSKEITEVMAIIRALKKLIPPDKMFGYKALDLCAGNGLLGVTLAHLFEFKQVVSVDRYKRNRNFSLVDNYVFKEKDIRYYYHINDPNIVLLANHPCKTAQDIAKIFCASNSKALILMPYCQDGFKAKPNIGKLSKYEQWCSYLFDIIWDYGIRVGEDIKVNIYKDNNCISPRNIIITAVRRLDGD